MLSEKYRQSNYSDHSFLNALVDRTSVIFLLGHLHIVSLTLVNDTDLVLKKSCKSF